ncbi:2-keto-4-pentenoate hydratase [Neokomagataea thailandica]|uniref:2-oxopent-4-enoate hydratase n=1 Tax=Neokomagataea tanensis NBRC 106556 TaxID=1223519 RepID=A0ABQ0QI10_9PROT|nr:MULTISPECIES: fumarylacetoacetate hydrolase family protein [Neokomagataea]GBR45524.1 2-oxopent-4-enoate hydratase [Neokomagataea tanensis NBRC 106556]
MTALNTASHDQKTALDLCAQALIEARLNHQPILETPFPYAPQTASEAYAIQKSVATAMSKTLGPVRGWKVGAPTPTAEPFSAPIHAATLFQGETTLPKELCHFYGVEAEIVYRFGKDLPAPKDDVTREEVFSAIISAHPAIEICDTRFRKIGTQTALLHLADQGNHGALIYGDALTDWASLTPVEEPVRLTANAQLLAEHKGGNSAGDPLRMLVWLAKHAAAQGFPIKAGDIVTTGSTTGTIFVEAGTTAKAKFASLGSITVHLP